MESSEERKLSARIMKYLHCTQGQIFIIQLFAINLRIREIILNYGSCACFLDLLAALANSWELIDSRKIYSGFDSVINSETEKSAQFRNQSEEENIGKRSRINLLVEGSDHQLRQVWSDFVCVDFRMAISLLRSFWFHIFECDWRTLP